MNPKHPAPKTPTITPGDIYYVLFRHKWLIAALSLVTVIAAIVAYELYPVPYQSEARLMIKYVHESKPPEQIGPEVISSSDHSGGDVINSEVMIMTSLDLANSVVDVIGPAKVLAKAGGGTNRIAAASIIRAGLVPEVSKSDVIEIAFTHPDPDMVQPILAALIDAYLAKHREVHQPPLNEFLQKQKDDVQSQIKYIDAQLDDLKQKAGIAFGDSEKSLSEQKAKILSEKMEAEAELASDQERIRQMRSLLPKSAADASLTNSSSSTNNAPQPPSEKVYEYQRICGQLNNLEAQEQDLLNSGLTTNANRVQSKHAQVEHAEAVKLQLEKLYPGLLAMKPVETKSNNYPGQATIDPLAYLNQQITQADVLSAKIQTLSNQLNQVQTKIAMMSSYDGQISQLQRDKELKEGDFAFFSRKVEEARVNEVVGPGNSNISEVESPTPPSRNMKKFNKMIAAILAGGFAFAFALPFLIEFYLDNTLKRPLDVQARLGLPFFVSIPMMNGKLMSRAIKNAKKLALLPGKSDAPAEPATATTDGRLVLWEEHHRLQPFYETLRDRLMTYFEMINLTHKPKLVAVTSCGEGAGVTSTAAGLASSLSETGEGNVLLVNMNAVDGEAHHFYKGKLACGLDEVLEKGTRENAFVQGNLYVAKEEPEDERLPRVLPKRFNHLLPKMKASDFDYIIFDMPPVSQISMTPRLARFMDMVLLVIESEKTDKNVAERAAAILSETKTNVGIVLNKSRAYGPRRHLHDV